MNIFNTTDRFNPMLEQLTNHKLNYDARFEEGLFLKHLNMALDRRLDPEVYAHMYNIISYYRDYIEEFKSILER